MTFDGGGNDSNGGPDSVDTERTGESAYAESLTLREWEALRRALELGYFDVPRAVTLVDLADDLDRTDVEVSQQIRQGMGVVLRTTDVLDDSRVIADRSTARSLDRMFDVLKNPYRRRILMLVSGHNRCDEDEFTVEDLATEGDNLELLTTELYYAHLPKLTESGYVEWDEGTHTIRRGPNFDEIAPLLRLMHDHQDELPNGWP